MQSAILKTYTESTSAPNEALQKRYGKYDPIMHHGIQKFAHKLNGVFLRTVSLDDKGVTIVNIPWDLKEIEGGSLNADKLVSHMIYNNGDL